MEGGADGQWRERDASPSGESIEHARRQIIDEIDMPGWYWWGLALGWVGLGIVTDVRDPWLTGGATLVFGAVHSWVSQRVLSGRRRTAQLSVRAEVAGRRAPLFVFGGLVVLVLVTIGGAVAASAEGARHPVTTASIVVAVLILLGGPRVMATVRGMASRSSLVS